MSLPSPIPIVYRSVTGLGFRVILVGVLGTTYKDYTDELELADLNLDYHRLKTRHTH